MSVRELVETVAPHLVLELYCTGGQPKLEHKGTFNLDVPASRDALLEAYGEQSVKHHDLYKAYVMVYYEAP